MANRIVVVAGGRTFDDSDYCTGVLDALHDERRITRIVCGCADGADRLGYKWARSKKIPVDFYPAWSRQYLWAKAELGIGDTLNYAFSSQLKSNGYSRNLLMARVCTDVVVFWDGESVGTKHMIDITEAHRKPLTQFAY